MNGLLSKLVRLRRLELRQALDLDRSIPRMQLVSGLVERGLFTEAQLLEAMSEHLQAPVAHLGSLRELREAQAAYFSTLSRVRAVLLAPPGDRLRVGTDNPLDEQRRSDLEFVFGRPVELVPVPGAELDAFLDPPRRDPGRTVAPDEWSGLLREALGEPVAAAERDGWLELSAAGVMLRLAEGLLVESGPVRLQVGAGQPWEIARQMAGRIVEIARRFRPVEGPAASPHELARVVASQARRGPPAPEHASVRRDGEELVVSWHFLGWVTSHETGPMARDVAWISAARIPSGWAALLLGLVMELVAWSTTSPPAICRFCERTFEPIDFDREKGTCHRCAEVYLGVVH